ncbi:hypothetical protein LTR85_002939 [Meristemomyces frigidus]|nr:hypothetical protein LTR85_002939 [Meristemomyces frigidus]
MAPQTYRSRPTPPQTSGDASPSSLAAELPLTPPNSVTSRVASFGFDTGDLADAVDLTEAPTPLLDAVDEHLKHYENDLSAVSESEEEEEDGEGPASDPEEYYKHQSRGNQPTVTPAGNVAVQTRSGHQRSSSAPAKALKSALAKSPPGSPPSECEGGMPRKKKARFVDDPSGSDLSLRRRATAPDYALAATVNRAFTQSLLDDDDGLVPWYGDDDDSGRVHYTQSLVMSANMLGEVDDALIAEADDAAAEMAKDLLVAETQEIAVVADSTPDEEDQELSSRGSVSDIEQRSDEDDEANDDAADSTVNPDDREVSSQSSTSDVDQFDDAVGQGDAGKTVSLEDVAGNDDAARDDATEDDALENDAGENDAGENNAGENDAGENNAGENDDAQEDATESEAADDTASQDDHDDDEVGSTSSVIADKDSEDERPFSTPLQAPNESIQMFIMELEPLGSRDDGPTRPPPGQEAHDKDVQPQLLPVIGETEVLTSAPTPRQPPLPPKALNPRRLSDPHLRGRKGSPVMGSRRRASSMTDFQKLHRLNLYPLKASPAECAVTACTVRAAEQPKVITVYQHPAARYKQDVSDKRPTQTIQTVCSGSSTYQMLWEEPPRSSSDSDMTLFEERVDVPDVNEPGGDGPEDSLLAHHISRTPSPMRKARTKLAAWSWAKEQEQGEDDDSETPTSLMGFDEGVRHRLSLLSSPTVDFEDPPAPPNTGKTSGASSARHSGPQSPYEEEETTEVDHPNDDDTENERCEDEDDADLPIELRFRSTLSRVRSMPASTDYLTVPTPNSWSLPTSPSGAARVPRRLFNLAAEEEHFKSHRDSVDLYHRRERKEEELNKQLMATRDSFVLAKTKYDTKHPSAKTAGAGGPPVIQYSRFGGLSPIMDASPPESRVQVGLQNMSRLGKEARRMKVEGEGEGEVHPDEHVGCAIYEVERPRWFEANCKRAVV